MSLSDIVKAYITLSVLASMKPVTERVIREVVRVFDVYPVSAVCSRVGETVCCYSDGRTFCGSTADAINKAIDYINTGIVFIRRGYYKLLSPINVRSDIALIGEGDRNTTLAREGSSRAIEVYEQNKHVYNAMISNMRILNVSDTQAELIRFDYASRSIISNVTLRNMTNSYGIVLNKGYWKMLFNIALEENNGLGGIQLLDTNDTILSDIIGGGSAVGIIGGACSYMNNIWYVGDAVVVKYHNIVISNITFDQCKTACVHIDATERSVRGVMITGGVMVAHSPGADIVRITVGDAYGVTNVIIRDLIAPWTMDFRSIVRKEGGGSISKVLIDSIFIPGGVERYYGFVADGVNIKITNDFYM